MGAIMLLGLAVVLMLAGCSTTKPTIAKDKINIVTSFYPLYDFASKIGGDRVNVINLVPAGVEPHDWSPKSGDIKLMNEAQLIVYEGAGFEGWIDDYAKTVPAAQQSKLLKASNGLSFLPGSEGGEAALDPHVWLSPPNAKRMAETIKNSIVQADLAHKEEYENNYKALADKFDALHRSYQEALGKTSKKDIVVSHQAFAYLCKEYGLNQKAIMGLAPDAEPTAKEMKSILDFVKQNQIKYIFFEELVSDKLASTLAKDAGVSTLTLNPLEGLTKEELAKGDDYFTTMENNLQNLLKALQ
jgi:zinc transport system substrate-binding protein